MQGGREGQEGQEGGAVERAVVCGEADPSPGVGRLQGGGRPSLGQGDLRGRLSEGVAALQQALLLAHLHPLLRSSYPMLSQVLVNVELMLRSGSILWGVLVKDHWKDGTNGRASLSFSEGSATVSITGEGSRGVHWSMKVSERRIDEVR